MNLTRITKLRAAILGACAVVVLGVGALPPAAAAPMEITITKSADHPLPIAIVPFDAGGATLPENVAEVIRSDLGRSGRFAPMPFADLPSHPSDVSQVNFKDWSIVHMDYLVIGRVTPGGDGNYTVEFRLMDTLGGKQIAGFQIPTSAANMRLTAHSISDLIYEALLKIKGAFATRIAYVTVEKRDAKTRIARLQVADSDGYGARTILESQQPLMSPAWSPDGNQLAYVSFEDQNSAIYIQDIRTGQREKIMSGSGINSSPAFSPDGGRLAITLSRDGNPEIYVLEVASKRLTRITTNEAIDTEAAWAPDGQSLVFTSDRGGGPQIYRVSAGGGTPQRVTFNMGNYNARASFSPNGKQLVMVTGGSGFRIAVLDLATGASQVITNASLDESPSYAPNGSMIMYATMGPRGAELAATSTDGRVKQRLALQVGEVREPAWGPYRK